MTMINGAINTSTGLTQAPKEMPEANQTTISESR